MRKIKLTQGYVTTVDDEDYDDLSQHKWRVKKVRGRRTIYAARAVYPSGQKGRQEEVLMHRYLTRAKKGEIVDHWDSDGLNNQKDNLRLTNGQGNGANKRKVRGKTTSKYKGVCYNKDRRKFRAHLRVTLNGKLRNITIGYYPEEKEAAKAYDAQAKRYFGSFALTNQMMYPKDFLPSLSHA